MPVPISNEMKAMEPATTPTRAPVLIGSFVELEGDIRKNWIHPWFYIRL